MIKAKSSIDLKKRYNYSNREVKLYLLKSIFNNQYLNNYIRMRAGIKLAKLNSNLTKIVNRCIVTGRSGGVLREFKVFRMTFKEKAARGHLVGVKKSSW
jgi:small subunit ribosomal protein S14